MKPKKITLKNLEEDFQNWIEIEVEKIIDEQEKKIQEKEKPAD